MSEVIERITTSILTVDTPLTRRLVTHSNKPVQGSIAERKLDIDIDFVDDFEASENTWYH